MSFRSAMPRVLAIFLLALTAQSWGGGDDCVTGTPVWQNSAIGSYDGLLVVTWQARPSEQDIDGVVALSMGAGGALDDYACLVRFNEGAPGTSQDGFIDVRNGNTYQADAQVTYLPFNTYYFRAEIDIVANTYSVWVRTFGPETQIASNYAFRTEQQGIGALDNWGVWSGIGSLTVCVFSVSYECGILPPPPAGTIFVDASNPACPGAGTAVNPYCRIQDAICVASNGDEIVLAPGTYFEAINLAGKAITLRSSGGAAVTTIDGTGLDGPVITCISGEGPTTVIEGLTVTGATTGASIADGFVNAGGGAFFDGSSPTVRDCVFIQNAAEIGGGVYLTGSSLIESCRFESNMATAGFGFGGGGGIYVDSFGPSPSPIVRDCTFIQNTGAAGAGLWSSSSLTVVEDCVFVSNLGSGLAGGGIVRRSTFESNTGRGIIVGDGGGGAGGVSMTVDQCLFLANQGGGLYKDFVAGGGGLVLTRSRFVSNSAGSYGGGLYLFREPFQAPGEVLLVSECEFVGNRAPGGSAAMRIFESSPTITNCTIVGHAAGTGGFDEAPISITSFSTELNNCVIWGNGPTPIEVDDLGTPFDPLASSIIDFYDGVVPTVITGQPPRFVDPLGPDGILGTVDDDLRVFGTSPAVDAGDNSRVAADRADQDGDGNTTEPDPFDLASNPRFQDDPAVIDTGIGSPPIVDIGAHEWVPGVGLPSGPRFWIDAAGGAWGTAGNWLGGVPGAADDAVFDLPDAYTAAAGGAIATNRFRVHDGDVTLDLEGGTYALSGTSGFTIVVAPTNELQTPGLTIGDGTLSAASLLVGDRPARVEILANATLDVGATEIRGEGELAGAGAILGDVTNLGRMDPGGTTVGTLAVTGDFTDVGQLPDGSDTTGMMAVTVTTGAHDELLVGGDAVLGGTLSIDLFDPPVEMALPIVTASQITGEFQGRIVGTALGGRTLEVLQAGDRVELIVRDINLAATWDNGGDYSIGSDVVPSDAVLADFNNDTLPDIAMSLPGDLDQVYVFFNNGMGADPNDIFNDAPGQFCIVSVGDDPVALEAADLNGDGWIDLAVVNQAGESLQILINDQDEQQTCFIPPGPAETTSVGRPTDVVALFADTDPIPDLAVSSLDFAGVQMPQDAVIVYTNSGGNGLTYEEQVVPVFGTPVALAAIAADRVDDDDDSIDDLAVVLTATSQLQVVPNDGAGTYVNTTGPIAVGTEPGYVEPEDIDRDGVLDLLVVNTGSSTLSVLLGRDGGDFDPTLSFAVGGNPGSVTFADDGDTLALVATNEMGERVVKVYRNESETDDIVLELDEERFVGENPVIIRASDFDQDGADDLIAITDPASRALAGGGGGPPPPPGFAAELQDPPCRADTDGNGSVGFNDLTGLLSSWGQSDVRYDFDENGSIGFGDLTILLNAWGPCSKR